MARNIIPANFVSRSDLKLEEDVGIPVPLTSCRVHDAFATVLPAAAANDDLGLSTGANTAHYLVSSDFGGTSAAEYAAFVFVLPPGYVAGSGVTLRLTAGMLTTVADTTANLDASCYSSDEDGTVSGDLVATAAQSINSLTLANYDFVVTPTTLTPGTVLHFRLSFVGSDSGDAGAMNAAITHVEVVTDLRGG